MQGAATLRERIGLPLRFRGAETGMQREVMTMRTSRERSKNGGKRRPRLPYLMTSILLAVGLLAAACGGDDPTATPTAPPPDPTATPVPSDGGTTPDPTPTPTSAPSGTSPTATPTTAPAFDVAGYYSGKRIRILVGAAPGGGTDREARYLAGNLGKFFPGNPGFIVTNLSGPLPSGNLLAKSDPDGFTMLVSAQALLDIQDLDVSNFQVADFKSMGGHVVPGNTYGIRGDLPYDTFEEARGSDVPLKFGSAAQTPGGFGAQEARLIILAEAFDFPLRILPITGAISTGIIMVPFERGEVNTLSSAWWRLGPLRPDWIEEGFVVPFAYFGSSAFSPPSQFSAPDPSLQMTGDYLTAWKALQSLTAFHKYLWLPPDTPPDLVDAFQGAWNAATADPEFFAGFKRAIGFDDLTAVSGKDFDAIMKQSAIDYAAGKEVIDRIVGEAGPKYFN